MKCSTLAISTVSSSSATASSAPLLENRALLAASAGLCSAAAAAAVAGERLPLRLLLLAPTATCDRENEGLTGGRGYPGLAGLLAGGAPTVAMLRT